VIAGSVLRLNTASHSSCSATGQAGSGGVTWYQLAASGS
jgi:hypothetical protein